MSEKEQIRRWLGNLIDAELKRQEITVYELAKRSGLPQQTARAIAYGYVMPKLDAVLAVERGLGRPAGWISRRLAELMADAK